MANPNIELVNENSGGRGFGGSANSSPTKAGSWKRQAERFPKDFGEKSSRFGTETPPEWMLKRWAA